MSANTEIKIVFGTMTFGEEGKDMVRVHDLGEAQKILDIFKSHGHNELDTARVYGQGSSEEMLAKLNVEAQGFKVSSKCFPSARSSSVGTWTLFTHSSADIERSINESLAALKISKMDIFYLHAPDRETPFEETLGAVNKAYEAGKFERFGISNYTADEVEQLVSIAKKNGWVVPSVYQGVYNAIARNIEPELIPVLRKHGLALYIFNPLGGGFFAGSFSKDGPVEKGSRFDPEKRQGQLYRGRYWNDAYFGALDALRPVAEKHQLTLAEISLRWLSHHSVLKRENGDAIIVGASSSNHIGQNLKDFEKGPLPEDVVAAVDQAWELVKDSAPKYHH